MADMSRVVFEYDEAWYEVAYAFYETHGKHLLLPNGVLLEHVGSNVGSYMLSTPPEAFGFKKIAYERGTMSLEEVALTHNAALARATENPF